MKGINILMCLPQPHSASARSLRRKPENQKTPVTESSGPPSEGFQLSAKVEIVSTAYGDSPVLKLSIKNVTSEILRLVVTTSVRDYQVTITNENGEALPLTDYGRQRQEAEGRRMLIEVQAEEEVQDEIPLGKLYNLTTNGTYSVTVKRKVFRRSGEGFAEVVSNTVKFTISG